MSDPSTPSTPPAGDPLRPTAEQKRVQETVMLDKQGLADLTAQAKAGAAEPAAPATPAPQPAAAPVAPAPASSGGANTKLIGLVIGLVALLVVVVIVGLALKG